MEKHSGGCLCGGVLFKLKGPLRPVIYCHCSQCRKTHGHFAAYTAVPRERIEWRKKESLSWYDSSNSARRGFCSHCGASLFYELHGSPTLSISAGVLDDPTGLSAAGHIYFRDRSDYYEIDDHLSRYDQEPDPEFRSCDV